MSKLLQKGRLAAQRRDVIRFTASIKDDTRLSDSVLRINKAHVVMMLEQGIINKSVASRLLRALSQFQIRKPSGLVEDIHMLLEEHVIRLAGAEVGGNLHIGKSRNDQVATAIRMFLRNEITSLMTMLIVLQESILRAAIKHIATLVPGYTHTQPAQPITFAHYLMSLYDAFSRDLERLEETYERVNESPMGAGALATTSFPIDRDRVARLLGFKAIVENSLDAVGSRDFILETQAHLAILATDVGRLAEDLILWSSVNFDTIELPDSFASTSSIMPQKKNPDVLEVIRARSSDVIGNLTATLTTLKGLPSGYNMDFQEITPKLWQSIENLSNSLNMLAQMLPLLKVKDVSDKLLRGYTTSTEVANILVRRYGIAFRTAHRTVGLLVREMLKRNLTFSDPFLDLLESALFKTTGKRVKVDKSDMLQSVKPSEYVRTHKTRGGPAPHEVTRMIRARQRELKKTKRTLDDKVESIEQSHHLLDRAIAPIMNTSIKSATIRV